MTHTPDEAAAREAAFIAFALRCSAENPAAIGPARNNAAALLARFGIEPREPGLFYHDIAADERAVSAMLATSQAEPKAVGEDVVERPSAKKPFSMLIDPEWCMRMAEQEGDYEIGAGWLHPEAPVPKLLNRAHEVVRHAPECPAIGGAILIAIVMLSPSLPTLRPCF